jgi:hypothetical protein
MPNKELAQQHKTKGNAALAAKDFEKAILEYTEVSGGQKLKSTRPSCSCLSPSLISF